MGRGPAGSVEEATGAAPDAHAAADADADAVTGPRRWPEVRWDRLFLVVAVVFGGFFAVATPPLQEHDAVNHLVRVDRISRGTFVEPLDDQGQTNAPFDGCVRAFVAHHTRRGVRQASLHPRGTWVAVPCGRSSAKPIPTSALTSPVPYLPNAAGYTAAKLAGGGVNVRVLAARLTGLAVYVVAVWAALRLAPKGRAVLFAVAVLPSSLALAAGVHADATAIWAAVLSVALVLRARGHPGGVDRAGLVALAGSLTVLALSKNLYAPYVLLVLLVPVAALRDRRAQRTYVAATVGVAGALLAAWSSYAARNHYVAAPLGIDSREAQSYVLRHPLGFLRSAWNGLWDPFFREVTLPGFVEVLGGLRPNRLEHVYGDLPPPAIVVVAAAVLVLAVLADPGRPAPRDPAARRQVPVVTGLVALGGVLLIWLGMALTANPPGAGALRWAQGRYFIPLVPLLAFAAGRRSRRRPPLALAVPAGSLFLLGWVSWRVFVVFY